MGMTRLNMLQVNMSKIVLLCLNRSSTSALLFYSLLCDFLGFLSLSSKRNYFKSGTKIVRFPESVLNTACQNGMAPGNETVGKRLSSVTYMCQATS